MGYDIYTRGEVTITPALPEDLAKQIVALTQRDLQGENSSIPFPVDYQGEPLRWCDWEVMRCGDYTSLQPFQPASVGWEEWLTYLIAYIKAEAPDTFTFDGLLLWEGDDHEDKGRVLVEADGKTTIQRQVEEMYEGSPEAEWARVVAEYFSDHPPAGLGRILTMWTEEDLALKYAEAACADCRNGTCTLTGDGHELKVYWDLPQEERDALVQRARDALGHSSEVEAAMDVLHSVVENRESAPGG